MIWTCSAQSWYEFPIDMEKLEKNVDTDLKILKLQYFMEIDNENT
jgi:hypothetical protein